VERFARAVAALSRASGVIGIALILVALVVICHMIFVRFVLGQSSIWQTEFVIFALIGSTFLGAPYVLLTRGHVNVDLVPLHVGDGARRVLALLAAAGGAVFALLVIWSSLDWWWEAWRFDFRTASMWRAPLWIPYASLPVGMALVLLQCIAEGWAVWTGRERPFGLPPRDGA